MKKIFLVITLLLSIYMVGCSNKNTSDEKQLIGFTIFERTTQIGLMQKVDKLTDITNGFYASEDYSYTNFLGDSFFDVKVDYSKLPGDLITPDSVCLFVNANYYQAQSINYKLFLYEIYQLREGGYSIEYKDELQLSPLLDDVEVYTATYESIKDSLNYVFTYKINIQKIATPKAATIKEFNTRNTIINEVVVTTDLSEYVVSEDAAYVIIEEKNTYLNQDNEEKSDYNYTLITKKSDKKTHGFKMLNNENRMISFQVSFSFPIEQDEE